MFLKYIISILLGILCWYLMILILVCNEIHYEYIFFFSLKFINNVSYNVMSRVWTPTWVDPTMGSKYSKCVMWPDIWSSASSTLMTSTCKSVRIVSTRVSTVSMGTPWLYKGTFGKGLFGYFTITFLVRAKGRSPFCIFLLLSWREVRPSVQYLEYFSSLKVLS